MNCPKCRQPLRLERQALFCDNCGWLHRVAPPGISTGYLARKRPFSGLRAEKPLQERPVEAFSMPEVAKRHPPSLNPQRRLPWSHSDPFPEKP